MPTQHTPTPDESRSVDGRCPLCTEAALMLRARLCLALKEVRAWPREFRTASRSPVYETLEAQMSPLIPAARPRRSR